mgnify:CR=1 FL=1
MANITCFGEVLWDVFPGNSRIGGAPLNVALRLHSFSHNVSMISAVGADEKGNKLLKYLEDHNLDTSNIQISEEFATSEVLVTLNSKGSATYEIVHPRAWDKIKLTETLKEVVNNSDALVFGSLVSRDETSKETLYTLVELSDYNIFDLNLRPPHYSKDVLIYLMNCADFIKFNDDELYKVARYLDSKYNGLEQNLKYISEKTNTQHICVTKGEHGAVLLYDSELYYNSGYQIKVKDTVGAGDSFLGTLISQLLNNVNPQKAIDLACVVGAMVAQSEGANPKLSSKGIQDFIKP